MKRLLLCYLSLAAAFFIALFAGIYAYHASHTYSYDELTFDSFSLDGNRLTLHVKSKTEGEYVYRLITSGPEDGKLTVTVRGGKQPALAQTPEVSTAAFYIDLPEGTKKIVCGKTTIYTVNKGTES